MLRTFLFLDSVKTVPKVARYELSLHNVLLAILANKKIKV